MRESGVHRSSGKAHNRAGPLTRLAPQTSLPSQNHNRSYIPHSALANRYEGSSGPICLFDTHSFLASPERAPEMSRRPLPAQSAAAGAPQASILAILQAGRSTGTIDLSDKGLQELPPELFRLDELPEKTSRVRSQSSPCFLQNGGAGSASRFLFLRCL